MRRVLLWLSLLVASSAAWASSVVWIVLSAEGGVYAESAAMLQGELRAGGLTDLEVVVGTWPTLRALPTKAPPSLVVTLGQAAFDGAAQPLTPAGPLPASTPLIASLLPSASFRAGEARLSGRPLTAVFIDPAPAKFFELLRKALPTAKRVGVLAGPVTDTLLPDVRKAAAQQALSVVAASTQAVGGEIYPALKLVLSDSDVLLALPEPSVYSSETLPRILLATYRARIPMVGFAPGYLTAGAVAALYVTPAQVVRETALKALAWSRRSDWGPARAPRELTVGINTRVAESLGLSLPSAETLTKELLASGVAP